jgi:hypothetical protein
MNTINLGFEKDFAKYSVHDFIEDLIESHDIKDFEGESKSLYQFDHKHEKAIHFYEQIILLGQGEITTSLIKLLVFNDPFENILQEVEPGESDDYDKFVWITSLVRKDMEGFINHWTPLCKVLKLTDSPELSAKDKAARCLMLTTGQTVYSKMNELSEVGNQYDLMFYTLFGSHREKAKDLHLIACSDRYDVYEMLQSGYSELNDENVRLRIELRKTMFDHFLSKHWNLDQESIDWFINLTRVALGDINGIDYISQQYNVLDSTTALLKSICTREIKEMDDLFKAISIEVN